MSKSYRKPYGTWVCTRVSEHDNKTLCSRIWRRAQNQVLREATRDESWDEMILPARENGKMGNEYDLRRDGHKRPYVRSRQYNNPYYGWWCHTPRTEEEVLAKWEERKAHDDWYIAWASRK